MNIVLSNIVGFFAAIIGSMGMGGGGILLMYISAFTDTPQLKAQGINLIFFIPIAIISSILHIKNRLVNLKAALLVIIGGIPSALLGVYLSSLIGDNLLRKAFAVFLIFLGTREIITAFKKKTDA